jgi:hypothetical protein
MTQDVMRNLAWLAESLGDRGSTSSVLMTRLRVLGSNVCGC